MLSEHYFGDVEAIDEGRNHSSYFFSTFVAPSSFALSALNNKRKFIIVGRKGSGKTAVQFHFSKQLEENGYLTHFFSFYNDLKPRDYNDAAQLQKIDMLGVANLRNIFLNYDFREIWMRTFLVKIAESLASGGFDSKFVRFVSGERSRLSTIFEGILKSANIKISAEMEGIAAEIGFDLSGIASKEMALDKFVAISLTLLERHHAANRLYLFVDELVFSKLDAADDEVRIRAAMVRDIFRSARDLNNFLAAKDLDFHVVCAVRPEIRDLINDLDAEIGKVFDGKSVNLTWDMGDEEDSLLYRLLKQKVLHSRGPKAIEFDPFVDRNIHFGSRNLTLEEFIRTNTWSRPRDVVQLLNAIADRNPNSARIGEVEIKSSLNEYGRRSFVEIVDEISVKHGPLIASTLRNSITLSNYRSFDEFNGAVLARIPDVNRHALLVDLFNFGVVGNYSDEFKKRRFYWAHRGEEFFQKSLGVSIHPGLWNYFNIR